MRPFIFRAWDKVENEITEVMDVDFSGKHIGVCNIPTRMFTGGKLHTIHSVQRDWDEVELMQYIGLKDENGVEIYEGDVLEKDSFWSWYVEYQDGGFRRVPTNSVQRINWEHHNLNQDSIKGWKVIGNIHENPELLEEEE